MKRIAISIRNRVFAESILFMLKQCKSVMLCDETAYPELAQDVMHAKQSRLIDGFFYASVTTGYLVASLSSL